MSNLVCSLLKEVKVKAMLLPLKGVGTPLSGSQLAPSPRVLYLTSSREESQHTLRLLRRKSSASRRPLAVTQATTPLAPQAQSNDTLTTFTSKSEAKGGGDSFSGACKVTGQTSINERKQKTKNPADSARPRKPQADLSR